MKLNEALVFGIIQMFPHSSLYGIANKLSWTTGKVQVALNDLKERGWITIKKFKGKYDRDTLDIVPNFIDKQKVLEILDKNRQPKEDERPYTGEWAMGWNECCDKLKSKIEAL